jgi:hypothetical protein
VTDSPGTGLVCSDGQRKGRTDPEFAALVWSAAARRGGESLPCWSHQQRGCCARPLRGAFRSHTTLEAQCAKLPGRSVMAQCGAFFRTLFRPEAYL